MVVGSVNVDTTMTVDRLPGAGETLLAADVRSALGGKGANQAVAARRQGTQTALVAALGDDSAGTGARDDLLAEGLDLDAVVTRPGVPTGAAHIAVDRHGANTILVAQGANGTLTAADVGRAAPLITSSSVVLVQLEIPVEAVLAAMRVGSDAGALTILNPAPARPIPAEILAQCRVLVPNEHEAARLSGEADPEAALGVLAAMAPAAVVIVTCGERGVLVGGAGHAAVTQIPAFAVKAVDTVAAGDAFCGVLAAALATGQPILDAVRRAGAAGAFAVTVAGAIPSLPTRAEVDQILAG